MAETLDHAAFWLPPQFLDDDDDEDVAAVSSKAETFVSGSGFGSFSDLSETESEEEKWKSTGSPQSTLGFEQSPSRGDSPTSPAPAPAPGTLDLLTAAAAKIQITDDSHKQHLAEQRRRFQIQQHHQQQLHFRKLQQQFRYQCAQNGRTTLGLPHSAWPTLQQAHQSGSGPRAVFPGNPPPQRECSGTGVFLPRQPGPKPETRRKPACPAVFLPARVVQALKLNLDDMRVALPQVQPRGIDVMIRPSNNQKKRIKNVRPQSHQQHQQQQVSHEIRLPQDWTY